MRGRCSAVLVAATALLLAATPVLADDPPPECDLELAHCYAPDFDGQGNGTPRATWR